MQGKHQGAAQRSNSEGYALGVWITTDGLGVKSLRHTRFAIIGEMRHLDRNFELADRVVALPRSQVRWRRPGRARAVVCDISQGRSNVFNR